MVAVRESPRHRTCISNGRSLIRGIVSMVLSKAMVHVVFVFVSFGYLIFVEVPLERSGILF